MINDFVGGKKASELLGVHQRTLYQWEEKGWIKTIRTNGGKRMYNVKEYLETKGIKPKEKNIKEVTKEINLDEIDKITKKLKICYARVSSLGQKEDLERQKISLKKNYPEHILIEDIGSGMNLNRRGLRKIIKLAIEGKIDEVVITYKDRLTRVGYELIEDLINDYSNGKIKIINKKDDKQENKEEELVRDVLEIMNIYVAKINGMRKYKNLKNK
jgi:predicted site-specific integrase-resolvase